MEKNIRQYYIYILKTTIFVTFERRRFRQERRDEQILFDAEN